MDTVAHVEMAPWDWKHATVTRFVLTLRDAPNADVPTATADWMWRLHDLADLVQA